MTLESLRKRAKSLLREVHARAPASVERVYRFHPRWRRFYQQNLAKVFRLADAQLVIARELGQSSWPALKAMLERGEDPPELAPQANPYLELIELYARLPRGWDRLRICLILSPLPGRGAVENRGQAFSDAKLDALIRGLQHEHPPVRRMCLELLDNDAAGRALPHILDCLEDKVARERWHAVHALGCGICKDGAGFMSPEVRLRLREVADYDPSQKVRAQARYHLDPDAPPGK